AVRADAEERLVSERDLARVAADDIPRQPHRRPEEDQRQDAMVIPLLHNERRRKPDRDHHDDRNPASRSRPHQQRPMLVMSDVARRTKTADAGRGAAAGGGGGTRSRHAAADAAGPAAAHPPEGSALVPGARPDPSRA